MFIIQMCMAIYIFLSSKACFIFISKSITKILKIMLDPIPSVSMHLCA